jgi:hypothetical protein
MTTLDLGRISRRLRRFQTPSILSILSQEAAQLRTGEQIVVSSRLRIVARP